MGRRPSGTALGASCIPDTTNRERRGGNQNDSANNLFRNSTRNGDCPDKSNEAEVMDEENKDESLEASVIPNRAPCLLVLSSKGISAGEGEMQAVAERVLSACGILGEGAKIGEHVRVVDGMEAFGVPTEEQELYVGSRFRYFFACLLEALLIAPPPLPPTALCTLQNVVSLQAKVENEMGNSHEELRRHVQRYTETMRSFSSKLPAGILAMMDERDNKRARNDVHAASIFAPPAFDQPDIKIRHFKSAVGVNPVIHPALPQFPLYVGLNRKQLILITTPSTPLPSPPSFGVLAENDINLALVARGCGVEEDDGAWEAAIFLCGDSVPHRGPTPVARLQGKRVIKKRKRSVSLESSRHSKLKALHPPAKEASDVPLSRDSRNRWRDPRLPSAAAFRALQHGEKVQNEEKDKQNKEGQEGMKGDDGKGAGKGSRSDGNEVLVPVQNDQKPTQKGENVWQPDGEGEKEEENEADKDAKDGAKEDEKVRNENEGKPRDAVTEEGGQSKARDHSSPRKDSPQKKRGLFASIPLSASEASSAPPNSPNLFDDLRIDFTQDNHEEHHEGSGGEGKAVSADGMEDGMEDGAENETVDKVPRQQHSTTMLAKEGQNTTASNHTKNNVEKSKKVRRKRSRAAKRIEDNDVPSSSREIPQKIDPKTRGNENTDDKTDFGLGLGSIAAGKVVGNSLYASNSNDEGEIRALLSENTPDSQATMSLEEEQLTKLGIDRKTARTLLLKYKNVQEAADAYFSEAVDGEKEAENEVEKEESKKPAKKKRAYRGKSRTGARRKRQRSKASSSSQSQPNQKGGDEKVPQTPPSSGPLESSPQRKGMPGSIGHEDVIPGTQNAENTEAEVLKKEGIDQKVQPPASDRKHHNDTEKAGVEKDGAAKTDGNTNKAHDSLNASQLMAPTQHWDGWRDVEAKSKSVSGNIAEVANPSIVAPAPASNPTAVVATQASAIIQTPFPKYSGPKNRIYIPETSQNAEMNEDVPRNSSGAGRRPRIRRRARRGSSSKKEGKEANGNGEEVFAFDEDEKEEAEKDGKNRPATNDKKWLDGQNGSNRGDVGQDNASCWQRRSKSSSQNTRKSRRIEGAKEDHGVLQDVIGSIPNKEKKVPEGAGTLKTSMKKLAARRSSSSSSSLPQVANVASGAANPIRTANGLDFHS
mmetsp:Transcript_4970/g.9049  ORF Transcript_4970/g.9049 Transcript_4970/m.9049 type:complete len:1159 (+) Transcript_4970:166-3642(+)